MSSSLPSSFKFQLLSDTHLEFLLPIPEDSSSDNTRSHFENPELMKLAMEKDKEGGLLKYFFSADETENAATRAPYLALLGDIGLGGISPNHFATQLSPFIRKCCKMYQEVFYVSGNHEYYSSSLKIVNAELEKLDREVPNFHFLNRTRYDVPVGDDDENENKKMRILGCTLWTKCDPAARKVLSDFKAIKKFGVDEMWELHDGDVAWLHEELSKAEEEKIPCVVMTHHSPIFCGIAIPNSEQEIEIEKAFKITGTDLLQSSSSSSCEFSAEKYPHSLKCWCWGHSHWNLKSHCDSTTVKGVQLFTNQYGYSSDDYKKLEGYQKCEIGKIFEVAV